MGAAGEGRGGFFERKNASDAARYEIEFGDGGGVPEGDEAALAVVSHDRGIGKRAGDAFELGEIEAVKDFAVGCVQENRFVRIVAGDENAFDAGHFCDAQASGIGDVVKFLAAKFSSRKFCARRERKKFFGSDAAVFKSVDGDAVASVSRFCAEGIGEARHRRVDMMAVETEGEAEEKSMMGVVGETLVGKVGKLVGFKIENGERLLFTGCVSAVAAVEEHSESGIGRKGGGSG